MKSDIAEMSSDNHARRVFKLTRVVFIFECTPITQGLRGGGGTFDNVKKR